MKLSEAVSSEFLRNSIQNGLILDTNAFLPAFTEVEVDREEKRIVRGIIGYWNNKGGKIILTPHILAEITNLVINRPRKGVTPEDADKTVMALNDIIEHYASKDQIMCYSEFRRFGFADMSILEACQKKGCAVLTKDESLCAELYNHKCSVMNFATLANRSLILDLYKS